MNKNHLDRIANEVQTWLTTGDMNTEILAEYFEFLSPFWRGHGKAEFIEKLVASPD